MRFIKLERAHTLTEETRRTIDYTPEVQQITRVVQAHTSTEKIRQVIGCTPDVQQIARVKSNINTISLC